MRDVDSVWHSREVIASSLNVERMVQWRQNQFRRAVRRDHRAPCEILTIVALGLFLMLVFYPASFQGAIFR